MGNCILTWQSLEDMVELRLSPLDMLKRKTFWQEIHMQLLGNWMLYECGLAAIIPKTPISKVT